MDMQEMVSELTLEMGLWAEVNGIDVYGVPTSIEDIVDAQGNVDDLALCALAEQLGADYLGSILCSDEWLEYCASIKA